MPTLPRAIEPFVDRVENDGFAILPGAVDANGIASLVETVERFRHESPTPRGAGIRNLLRAVPEVEALAASRTIRRLVEPILGAGAFPARGILFDKTPSGNWKVPWHQDLTIAVSRRVETPGFGPWTVKDGVHHVQPPTEILEQMLAVRIHLDDCGETNGPLRVIPGTHRRGRMTSSQIQELQKSQVSISCLLPRQGVILMRPLLLHASSAATSPAHRRVIHIEYAATELPGNLCWHSRQGCP